jgi:hypothetical protein
MWLGSPASPTAPTRQIFARAITDLGGTLEVIIPGARYRDGLPPEAQPEYDRPNQRSGLASQTVSPTSANIRGHDHQGQHHIVAHGPSV